LGYLVDAVSTDVFTGGNKYSRDFTNFYFNGAISVGIGTSERLQSVYSFNSLRDYCNKAITNQLNLKDVGISSGPANMVDLELQLPFILLAILILARMFNKISILLLELLQP
jgi:hypothetical protein